VCHFLLRIRIDSSAVFCRGGEWTRKHQVHSGVKLGMRGQLGTAHFSVAVLLYWVGMRYNDLCVCVCVCVHVASARSTLYTNYKPDQFVKCFMLFRWNQSINQDSFHSQVHNCNSHSTPCSFADVALDCICAKRRVNIIMWRNLKPLTLFDVRSEPK
jgi:hypothetical protein